MFTIGIIKSDVYAEGKADEITEKVDSVPDIFFSILSLMISQSADINI